MKTTELLTSCGYTSQLSTFLRNDGIDLRYERWVHKANKDAVIVLEYMNGSSVRYYVNDVSLKDNRIFEHFISNDNDADTYIPSNEEVISANITNALILIRDYTIAYFDISLDEYNSPSRKTEHVLPRQYAHYFIRTTFGNKYSLSQIAKVHGLRDHATALNSIKVVKAYLETSKEQIAKYHKYEIQMKLSLFQHMKGDFMFYHENGTGSYNINKNDVVKKFKDYVSKLDESFIQYFKHKIISFFVIDELGAYQTPKQAMALKKHLLPYIESIILKP